MPLCKTCFNIGGHGGCVHPFRTLAYRPQNVKECDLFSPVPPLQTQVETLRRNITVARQRGKGSLARRYQRFLDSTLELIREQVGFWAYLIKETYPHQILENYPGVELIKK